MTDVFSDLEEIMTEVFGRPIKLLPTTTAPDVVGWDSFRHIEILLALEEKYDIELPTTEVARARSVGELAALITSKLGSADA